MKQTGIAFVNYELEFKAAAASGMVPILFLLLTVIYRFQKVMIISLEAIISTIFTVVDSQFL